MADLRPVCARPALPATVIPVLCGSSLRNKGVQPMLDAVVDYLPSPLDTAAGDRHRSALRMRRRSASASETEPFSRPGLQDRQRSLCGPPRYFRVYSGKLPAGSYVLNSTKGKKERVGRLLQMHADHREDITEVTRAISRRWWV